MSKETGEKSLGVAAQAPDGKEKAAEIVLSKESVQERGKRAREANETNHDVIYTFDNHELGKYELSAEQLAKRPKLSNKYEFRALGGVDSTPFNPDKIDQAMVLKMSDWANKFAALCVTQNFVTNFETMQPANQPKMLAIIDKIAQASLKMKQGTFDLEAFKEKLVKDYGDDWINGPQGAWNLLLAVHRADEAVKGMDVSKVVYDLRVGKKKLQQALRYSEIWQKGAVDNSKQIDGKKQQELDSKVVDVQIAKLQKEEALKLEREKSAVELGISLEALGGEFKAKYGYEVKFKREVGKNGDVGFTTKVKNKAGNLERTFNARVLIRDGKVAISLSSVSFRDDVFHDNVKDAVEALKAKMDVKLKGMKDYDKTEVEDLNKNFLADLKVFFSGNYLRSSVRVSKESNGLYAGGVKVEDAFCSLQVGNEVYFVYPNADARTIDLKKVEEFDTNKFALKTVKTIPVSNLRKADGSGQIDEDASDKFGTDLSEILFSLTHKKPIYVSRKAE